MRSPTSTVPGSAADCSREAVLTRSPVTMPWSTAPTVAAASPVRTPARASSGRSRVRPSAATAGTISSAARTARSASSSCATGVPHTAITASPMNFSTTPPWRAPRRTRCRSSCASTARTSSASRVLGERREADEVDEQHGHQPALGRVEGCAPGRGPRRPAAGAAAGGGAALAAELAVGLFAAAAHGARERERRPHSLQNLRPDSFAVPQFAQSMATSGRQSTDRTGPAASRGRRREGLADQGGHAAGAQQLDGRQHPACGIDPRLICIRKRW